MSNLHIATAQRALVVHGSPPVRLYTVPTAVDDEGRGARLAGGKLVDVPDIVALGGAHFSAEVAPRVRVLPPNCDLGRECMRGRDWIEALFLGASLGVMTSRPDVRRSGLICGAVLSALYHAGELELQSDEQRIAMATVLAACARLSTEVSR